MVKIDIGHRPEFTYEQLLEILERNLTYRMQMWSGLGEGVAIFKNNFLGAIVKIKQSTDTTFLVVESNPPSIIIRVICALFGVIIGLIVLTILSIGFAKKVAEEIRLMTELQVT